MNRPAKGQLRLGVLGALILISFGLDVAAANQGGLIVNALLVAEACVAVIAIRVG